jgi:hypothetical protein
LGFANDFKILLKFEHLVKPFADNRVILGEQYGYFFHFELKLDFSAFHWRHSALDPPPGSLARSSVSSPAASACPPDRALAPG